MLRPVDVTLTIQHASDALRASSGDANAGRPEVAQKMFAERLEKELREREKQANEVGRSEKGEVNPDRRGDGTGYFKNGKTKSRKPLTKQDKVREFSGESMFDIRV